MSRTPDEGPVRRTADEEPVQRTADEEPVRRTVDEELLYRVTGGRRSRRQPAAPRLGLGLLVLAVPLTVAFGVPGLALAVALTAGWYFLPVTYVVAAGYLLVLGLSPGALDAVQLVAVTAGFLALLAVATPTDDRPTVTLAALGVGALALLGATWLGLGWGDAVWAGALVLGLAFAAASYGLHRYELVNLGLVEASDE